MFTVIIDLYFRDVGDGLCEMEGRVTIDSDLLKHQAPLTYKYLIYSSQKGGEDDSPYEFLHDAPGHAWGGTKIVDRKFVMSREKFVTKGYYV